MCPSPLLQVRQSRHACATAAFAACRQARALPALRHAGALPASLMSQLALTQQTPHCLPAYPTVPIPRPFHHHARPHLPLPHVQRPRRTVSVKRDWQVGCQRSVGHQAVCAVLPSCCAGAHAQRCCPPVAPQSGDAYASTSVSQYGVAHAQAGGALTAELGAPACWAQARATAACAHMSCMGLGDTTILPFFPALQTPCQPHSIKFMWAWRARRTCQSIIACCREETHIKARLLLTQHVKVEGVWRHDAVKMPPLLNRKILCCMHDCATDATWSMVPPAAVQLRHGLPMMPFTSTA